MELLDIKFEKEINASKEKVWDALWIPENYTNWAQFFMKDSVMKTDWKIGGKTYFLSKEGDGMVSTIKELEPNKKVVFENLGFIQDGVEDTESEEVAPWVGILESYELIETPNGKINLIVTNKTTADHLEFMENGFNKGLQIVKELAES